MYTAVNSRVHGPYTGDTAVNGCVHSINTEHMPVYTVYGRVYMS